VLNLRGQEDGTFGERRGERDNKLRGCVLPQRAFRGEISNLVAPLSREGGGGMGGR